METHKGTPREEVLNAILGALRNRRQDWEIKGAIVHQWVDLVIPDLAGGA